MVQTRTAAAEQAEVPPGPEAPGRPSSLVVVGAVFGALAVAAGAFGAHGLKARLDPEALAWWKTGAEYHLLHAVLLVVIGFAVQRRPSRGLCVAGMLVALGIVLFSGSLYALALSGVRALGAVTPLGGGLLLGGWVALAIAARGRPTTNG